MTFVSYPDLLERSPEGRLTLSVRGSPETRPDFRDRSRFVYELRDATDRLLWSVASTDDSQDRPLQLDYPHQAWVSDEGWVVVRTHAWCHAGLVVISPDGELQSEHPHRSRDGDGTGFLDGEPDECLGDSSAGPLWASASFAGFLQHEGRTHWSVRTWWGKRVVFDLGRAAVVQPTGPLEDALTAHEQAWVLRHLAQAATSETALGASLSALLTAALHAGRVGGPSAVPYLRRLETSQVLGGQAIGPCEWGTVIDLPLRQAAKLSLLRLGEEPAGWSHYRIERDGEPYEFPERVADRSPAAIEVGLNQKALLQRLGAPDLLLKRSWEYDFMGGAGPFTIRVQWRDPHWDELARILESGDEEHLEAHADYERAVWQAPPRIESVERLDPPPWQNSHARDLWLR